MSEFETKPQDDLERLRKSIIDYLDDPESPSVFARLIDTLNEV